MIKWTFIDFIFRMIPEGFLVMLLGYTVAKEKIKIMPYIGSAGAFAVCTFILKSLPISSVLSSILSAIAAVILMTYILKIKIKYSLVSTIIFFILTLIGELINMIVLSTIFSINTTEIFINSTPIMRNLYGLPSLIILGFVIGIYVLISKLKQQNKPN